VKISSQEEYGLRCLMHLARASARGSATIHEIAAAEGLTPAYVAKLLTVLRRAGLISSVRGRAGGYTLSRPPEEVGLGVVMKALGEPLFDEPEFCERHAGTETDGVCVHRSGCTLRALWEILEEWLRSTLDQVTLADLIQGHQHLAAKLRHRLSSGAPSEPSRELVVLEPLPAARLESSW